VFEKGLSPAPAIHDDSELTAKSIQWNEYHEGVQGCDVDRSVLSAESRHRKPTQVDQSHCQVLPFLLDQAARRDSGTVSQIGQLTSHTQILRLAIGLQFFLPGKE
jgi:hypothetical protein